MEKYRYTLAELQAKRTLTTGQTDDLKIDTGSTRIWLARVTVAHGAEYNNKVTVEQHDGRRWVIVDKYQAM